jgi:tetratricopeptide (TPR) repeat protein
MSGAASARLQFVRSRVRFLLIGGAMALSAAGFAREGAAQSSAPPSVASMRELARQVALDLEHRAAVAERDGQPMQAEALLRRAMEADPGYLPPYLGYSRLLAARGRVEEAAHILTIVPARAVDGEHDLVELARAHAQIGDLDGALELLDARPNAIEPTRERAQLCARAGRFPEALLAARRFSDIAVQAADQREARVLVRALSIIVGEADAVRVPMEATALRNALAN